jgi:hypothetical protein
MKELRGRIIFPRLLALLVVFSLALLSLSNSKTNLIRGEGGNISEHTKGIFDLDAFIDTFRQPVLGGQKNLSCIFVLQRSTMSIVRPTSTGGCGNSPNTIKIGSSLPTGYTHVDGMDFM